MRVRCPLCGMVVWLQSILKPHRLEFYRQQSHGGYHGWVYHPINADDAVVRLIMERIKGVLEEFEMLMPKVSVFESVQAPFESLYLRGWDVVGEA